MKKKWIILSALAISSLFLKAQENNNSYKKKILLIDEISFLSSYYSQEGNHAAVTGGEGSEQLTDATIYFDTKITLYANRKYSHKLGVNIGVDWYTSASSDKIDPNSVTSPSYSDNRIYPSANYTFENQNKQYDVGVQISYSDEYDYNSLGFGMQFSKTSKDNSRLFNVGVNAFLDEWKVIKPVELRPEGYGSGSEDDNRAIDKSPRNIYSLKASLSQIINKRLQVALVIEPSYQEGLLSTPFQRVYFSDGIVAIETLPGTKMKMAASVRANYFALRKLIVRSFLRYYTDDWGMNAVSAQIGFPIKITPKFSVSPVYRSSIQSGIKYFNAKNVHIPTNRYYTSDYDMSSLNSHFASLELHYADQQGILKIPVLKEIDVRGGYYMRSDGLSAYIFTLGLQVL